MSPVREPKRPGWRMVFASIAVCAATLIIAPAPARAQKVVLYTASNADIEKAILDAFAKAHPEIKVDAINLSTGPIVQRAIAEKANPQADVVWMINNVALDQLKAAGVFEPYEPKGAKVADEFRDPDGFWVAHNGTVMAMAVNTKLLKGEEPADAGNLAGSRKSGLQRGDKRRLRD